MGTDGNNDMLLIWGLAILGLYAVGSKHFETIKFKLNSPEFQILFSVIVGRENLDLYRVMAENLSEGRV